MYRLLLPALCLLGLFFSFASCSDSHEHGAPEFYGRPDIAENGDSSLHVIRPFSFTDQQDRTVTNQTVAGKLYVADFFFTSCPTICPKVKQQMLRIEQKFGDRIMLLSHTIDPKRDTPEHLKEYATKVGVKNQDNWRFLTGDKFEIYDIAEDYMSVAVENADAPGGFDHSGYILLVDGDGHLRGYASGLDPAEVDHLMEDIDYLLEHPQEGYLTAR